LATGLASLDTSIEKHWVGWPGIFTILIYMCMTTAVY
jgi:hypothetical protein